MPPTDELVDLIAGRLDQLRARITRAGGVGVTIVGVTKRHPIEVLHAAVAAGISDLGENYAQELVEKAATPGFDQLGARVHFIGQLQSNKVRMVAPIVDVIQTIDRPALVTEVARRSPGAEVMVQVDLTGIEGRGGASFETAPGLAAAATDAGLTVIGVMGVAAPGDPDASARFTRLRSLRDELGVAECSMGMTDDLDDAVAAGATMVRVGSALFGARDGI